MLYKNLPFTFTFYTQVTGAGLEKLSGVSTIFMITVYSMWRRNSLAIVWTEPELLHDAKSEWVG